jgi:hypothetical protein
VYRGRVGQWALTSLEDIGPTLFGQPGHGFIKIVGKMSIDGRSTRDRRPLGAKGKGLPTKAGRPLFFYGAKCAPR